MTTTKGEATMDQKAARLEYNKHKVNLQNAIANIDQCLDIHVRPGDEITPAELAEISQWAETVTAVRDAAWESCHGTDDEEDAVICGVCSDEVRDPDGVKCETCEETFHADCTVTLKSGDGPIEETRCNDCETKREKAR